MQVNKMVLMVHKNESVTFQIYYGVNPHPTTYGFMNVGHFMAHFGNILPLTDGVRFRIYAVV